MLAYLVIREGSKWTDVFRLIPGQAVTIGRAPTNQVVLKDERCSRYHAEVFSTDNEWVLRDLESRNGTAVGDRLIEGDHVLTPGEVIRVGRSYLKFVFDLRTAFPDSGHDDAAAVAGGNGSATDAPSSDSGVLTEFEASTITHRREQTRYLSPRPEASDSTEVARAGRAAARLCRLAFELAQAPDAEIMAERALDGIFESTQADTGAILRFAGGYDPDPDASELEVLASRTTGDQPYHRVSPFLASTVLREGAGVIARNVMGDSKISTRDSHGEIHATSVICAPIRRDNKYYGLLHLYTTDPDRVLDPEDLEFALAVADTAAVALETLSRQQELSENLSRVRDENVQLRERLGVQSEIIGKNPSMLRITEEIARAAPTRSIVLVRGESGVGKELVARAVHFSSPRRKGPFVCVNCAALSETLLESELFGHEKGAFTGATERKIGKFEAAHHGTLMLDEIGEMSPTIQAKFLRVLEGHPFERVGGSAPVTADVRVIAATNRDLEKDVAAGRFRRDLYFRLNVLEIVVPALRKRPEDIPILASYFLQKLNGETGRRIAGFTPRAMERMMSYRWPGNVRELKNVVERAVLLAQGPYIDQHDLMLSKLPTAGDTTEFPTPESGEFQLLSLAEWERMHVLATLKATGWNKSQAAGILGIERSTLDRKIRRYGLDNRSKRHAD